MSTSVVAEPASPSLAASPRQRMRGAVELLLIAVAGLVIYGWRLGTAPIAGTEPLRALVAHQMAQQPLGDAWLLPRIYGELYLRKPPLQYWIIAITERAAGRADELIWRAPSAIGSVLLAVILAAWAARWFGPRARLVAGFTCLSLVALWAQDRGADIDALDTAAAVIAACGIIQLCTAAPSPGTPGEGGGEGDFGRRADLSTLTVQHSTLDAQQQHESHTNPLTEYQERAPLFQLLWGLLLAVSVGALLLLKGPAGLPTVLGAIIGCAAVRGARGGLKRPALWTGLAAGGAVFALWLAAVAWRVHALHLHVDTSGAQEAEERLLPHSFATLGPALLAPVLVLVYALPASLGLLLAKNVSSRLPAADVRRVRLAALAAALLASLGVGVAAGIVNPRYSYVPLPLLAPLLGGAVAIALETPGIDFAGARQVIAASTRVLAPLWTGAVLLLSLVAMRAGQRVDVREQASVAPPPLLAVCIAACLIGGWATVSRSSLRWRGWALAVLVVLLGIPFAAMKNAQRLRYSGRATGAELRQDVNGQQVDAANVVRDLPQVLYYAQVPVRNFGEHGVRKLLATPGERWVLLDEDKDHPELADMHATVAAGRGKMLKILPLRLAGDTLYLVRYVGPSGSSTSPSTATTVP